MGRKHNKINNMSKVAAISACLRPLKAEWRFDLQKKVKNAEKGHVVTFISIFIIMFQRALLGFKETNIFVP